MKYFYRILQVLVCIIIGAYAALIFALDQPRVQEYLANIVEQELGKHIGSEVKIDHICVGLFNAVELHGVTLYDQQHEQMLQSELVYGKVNLPALIKRKVYLRNISVIDGSFKLYKSTDGGDINFKYIIDAFKTDKKPKKPLDLVINSLQLRRCQLAYDEKYAPYPADNRFSAHHVFLRDVNANLSLKQLTKDNISLRVRQLSLTEQSGFRIESMRMQLLADRKHADIHHLDLRLPNSRIQQNLLSVDYDLDDLKNLKNSIRLSAQFDDVQVASKDIAAFVPVLKQIDETIVVSTKLQYEPGKIVLEGLDLRNAARTVELVGNVDYRKTAPGGFELTSEAQNLMVTQSFVHTLLGNVLQKEIPAQVKALGDVQFKGSLHYVHNGNAAGLLAHSGNVKGNLVTALGPLDADVKLEGHSVAVDLASSSFKPSLLVDNKYVPTFIDFALKANTELIPGASSPIVMGYGLGATNADVDVKSVIIDNQSYHNIRAIADYNNPSFKLHLTTDDPAAKLQADLATQLTGDKPWASLPEAVTFDAKIAHLSPSQLRLTDKLGRAEFALTASGKIESLDMNNLKGNIDIAHFSVSGDRSTIKPFYIDNLSLATQPAVNGNHVMMRSEFVDLDYSGPIHPDKLKQIAQNVVSNVQQGVFNEEKSASLIAQGEDPQTFGPKEKTINFILALKDASFFQRFLGVKANYEGVIQARGSATDDGNELSITCTAPTLTFGKFSLLDTSLYVHSEDGSFNVLGKARKTLKNGDVRVELTAVNRDGRICTDVEWDEVRHHAIYGKLSAISKIDLPSSSSNALQLPSLDIAAPSSPAGEGFVATAGNLLAAVGEATTENESKAAPASAPAKKSKFGFTTEFTPSLLCIGDSIWQFSESKIDYHNDRIIIDNFGIHNSTQSLAINGVYDRTFEDAITVDLNNIDLDYVLAFARLTVVEFSGHATGQISVKALPNGMPWAKAFVNVPDLQFNHVPFGNADVTLGWDHEQKDITFDGIVREKGIGHTTVKGYVDPINRDLDLQTESKNTQLGFLNKYTEGIFSNINGRATGHCRIYGGFQSIEFSGREKADCEATIPVTGVTYKVHDADVDIIPDAFIVKSATIRDKYEGKGTATGLLTHTHIKDMCYDFKLSGENLRLYDKPRELDMPFFATATGSGDVHIHGKPGNMNAEMRITTHPGSELTYILDSPDADVSQLIKFRDVTPAEFDSLTVDLPIAPIPGFEEEAVHKHHTAQAADPAPAPSSTDINLYFEVDVDDNSCLHLITDDKSGDAITVYGSGPIQANYHNKSGFQMYGTYNIDRGTYNLNIPTLAQRRKFDILSGGRVTFSGDPANAEVKVKAQYVVNSASLADLNIGTGFANNTTRVNCLVDIYGEVANMQFDLGIELPNCSEDEQQMVNNLIASDEDRTMQVLYLLGVGRFYAYNYTAPDIAQSQSVLMMNSLLSSTLSSQLNNIISDAVGNSNWTIGTNISTGQLGWSDMEVEGLVSSRLLNNRLLINGNFGYSERQAATTNFVGDFDVQYLITPKGSVSVKAYSETNDRYFTKSTLTTQGVGLQLKKDFTKFGDLFRRRREPSSNSSAQQGNQRRRFKRRRK